MATDSVSDGLLHLENLEIPEKLSDWLLLALKELERVSKLPNVAIDMFEWLRPPSLDRIYGGKCVVCLAGAVMLAHLPDGITPGSFNKIMVPGDCNGHPNMEGKLYALNALRKGDLIAAAEKFYGRQSEEYVRIVWLVEDAIKDADLIGALYWDNQFIPKMRERAAWLAEHGF